MGAQTRVLTVFRVEVWVQTLVEVILCVVATGIWSAFGVSGREVREWGKVGVLMTASGTLEVTASFAAYTRRKCSVRSLSWSKYGPCVRLRWCQSSCGCRGGGCFAPGERNENGPCLRRERRILSLVPFRDACTLDGEFLRNVGGRIDDVAVWGRSVCVSVCV